MPAYRLVPIEQLREPQHPVRASMDERALEQLADSIRAVGLIEPLIVREDTDHYEVVAGHRRLRACQAAGMREVPCLVFPTEEAAAEAVKLHENLYREDLTAAEEGWFFCELMERYGMDEDAVANLVRHPKRYVFDRIELVKTDQFLAELVAERQISFGVARELLKIPDQEVRHYYARQAALAGCTIRQARTWVDNYRAAGQPPQQQPQPAPEQTAAPVPENPMRCFFCGGGDVDPYNLRPFYCHWWEFEAVKRLLREAGIQVP